MGGVALLARAAGHTVSGSDANVYPPMSTQLEEQAITLMEGYDPAHLDPAPDMVVVGNVMTRGNPAVEHMLNRGIPYTSGPQWLSEYVLRDRWVLAVAGTHGKTTTSSMLAWILEYAGLEPGFLIGGIPQNFGLSARFGKAPFFVVEADEYDTAFFDKRSKFVHYHPRTLVLNNLEFDHADIFPDLDAIKRQFHHLVRTVPGEGLVVSNSTEKNIDAVLEMGCWTPVESFGVNTDNACWQVKDLEEDGSAFTVICEGEEQGRVEWSLLGLHNVNNALAAITAARHSGVPTRHAIEALAKFKNVKRRMELRKDKNGIRLYDDFAHHPTAIETTLSGLRNAVGDKRIIVLLEPRSNTMRMGIHKNELAASLELADIIFLFQPEDLGWDLDVVATTLGDRAQVVNEVDTLVQKVSRLLQPGDQVLVMSNGGFGGIHVKLEQVLEERA
jgi:UDP-N-acetylmuramate: L-alanyl-gamma-D-glutamyl-meso-diaminopimelate ligase